MHRRYLHSSLVHSADVVKRTSIYPRSRMAPQSRADSTPASRAKFPKDPALNDSQRIPNVQTHINKTFPPFDAEELIEQQSRLRRTPSERTKSSSSDNDAIEYATTILDSNEYLPDITFSPGTFVEVRKYAYSLLSRQVVDLFIAKGRLCR